MNKISENVSEQLETAAQEALQQMDPFQQLMNAGIEYEKNKEKPKRKRRTKAEIEAARTEEQKTIESEDDELLLKCDTASHITVTVDKWDQEEDDDNILPKRIEIPDDILVGDYDNDTISDYISNLTGYCHYGFTYQWKDPDDFDQFCEYEIEKAHLDNREEPDFDYRVYYTKGEKVYLVRHYPSSNKKEMLYLTLRTVYPRMIVGIVDKYGCQCIGYNERHNIFMNRKDAMDCFDKIQAEAFNEYDEETGKKKRKHKKAEEDKDITDSESYDDESEDEDNE